MMKTVRVVACVLAAGLAGGCGGGGVEGGLDELEAAQSDYVGNLCDCHEQMGFASEAACVDEVYQPMTATERDCLVAALEQDAEASEAFLDCVTPRVRDVSACVAAIQTCDDSFFDRVNACVSAEDNQLDACQDLLPAAVDAAADACFE